MNPVTKNGKTTPFDPDNPEEKKAFCDCYKKYRAGCNLVMPYLNKNKSLTVRREQRYVPGGSVSPDGAIQYNPQDTSGQRDITGNTNRPAPISLAHEMGHKLVGVSDFKSDHAKATAVENQVRQELGLPPVNELTPMSSGTMEQHFGADWKNKKIVDESDKCLCEDKEGP
jgi:hypothetical protein